MPGPLADLAQRAERVAEKLGEIAGPESHEAFGDIRDGILRRVTNLVAEFPIGDGRASRSFRDHTPPDLLAQLPNLEFPIVLCAHARTTRTVHAAISLKRRTRV